MVGKDVHDVRDKAQCEMGGVADKVDGATSEGDTVNMKGAILKGKGGGANWNSGC